MLTSPISRTLALPPITHNTNHDAAVDSPKSTLMSTVFLMHLAEPPEFLLFFFFSFLFFRGGRFLFLISAPVDIFLGCKYFIV